jgi:hypothetical protein
VLGVLCRGTDYVNLKPHLHAVPFSAEETIELVKKHESEYDRIYIATEDEDIWAKFKASFPEDKLYYTQAKRYRKEDVVGYISESIKTDGNLKQNGYAYLTVLYVLANCTSLITAPTGGGVTAIRINGGKYEWIEICKKGEYL